MSLRGHSLYGSNDEPLLSPSCQSILMEPLHLLEGERQRLVRRWVELYLLTFGRKTFFSPERVHRIFDEFAVHFLACLRRGNFDRYFELLKERGRLFSEIGVPFEEVILCLQLFEEAYIWILLHHGDRRKFRTEDLLMAFQELNHLSTAAFAVSYFHGMKSNWQNTCRGYQEETARLQEDLKVLHEEYFSSTHKDLTRMELLLQGINRKLRKSVIQSRRLQLFAECLDRESTLRNLLRVADPFVNGILPAGSEIIWGILDESRHRAALYSSLASEDWKERIPELLESIYFSELPLVFQNALFQEEKTPVRFSSAQELPFLMNYPALAQGSDFVFLPLRKFNDVQGFIVLSASQPHVFVKANVKYFARLGRIFSQSLFGLIHFNRTKRHSEFISILQELEDKVLERNPLETTLDFCIGSLIDLLEVERASLMLLDPGEQTLSVYAAKGLRVYPFSGLMLKWGEGIAGWALKEQRIVAIPRCRIGTGSSHPEGSSSVPWNVQSLVCAPIVFEGKPLGVINLSTLSYVKTFGTEEMDILHQFAQRMGQALSSLTSLKAFRHYLAPALKNGPQVYP